MAPPTSSKVVDPAHSGQAALQAQPGSLLVDAPEGQRRVELPAGDGPCLAELLRQQQLALNTRCGHRGWCDGCVVELTAGSLRHVTTGKLVQAQGQPLAIKSCEYQVHAQSGADIRIAARSLLAQQPQVVSTFKINVSRAHDPLYRQLQLILPAVVADDDVASPALAGLLGKALVSDKPIRICPGCRDAVAALAGRQAWLSIEYRGDHWLIRGATHEPRQGVGAAIDIGTTTVALLLIDLETGRVLGKAAGLNQQIELGDNVLTRINRCTIEPGMTQIMQQAVIARTLEPLLTEALEKSQVDPARLSTITIAANTTMLHLAVGEDPSSIGVAPFTPRFLEHRVYRAGELGLAASAGASCCAAAGQLALAAAAVATPAAVAAAHPPVPALLPSRHAPGGNGRYEPSVHLLPSAAGYVGADLTAGVFASGLIYDEGPSLLVDVGTNGEIILKSGARMLGCATAAGPAFEGSGLSSGLRATHGAIEHIRVDAATGRITCEVIGGEKPIGICGSGFVDFLAQGRQSGLLEMGGRFSDEWRQRLGADITQAPRRGQSLTLSRNPAGDVMISESDVAALLQAKAAIAAGILTLLTRVGMTPADVKTLYLAGGFGLHINIEHAIACGLLPGFSPGQVQVVGNTSLAGAYLSLLDCRALDEIIRVAANLEIIELNLDPEFEGCYIEQLMLGE